MKYRRALPSDIASFLRANPSSLALDTETTGLNPRKDTLLDIVLANREEAIIFSAEHRDALLGAKQLFIMHNAKFDLAFLHHNGVTIPAENVFDTMLMDHLRDENSPHGLDHIIKTRWNDNYKELFWARFKNYEDADDEAKVAYACKDAIYTYRLFEHLEAELQVPWSLVLHVHKLAAALYDTEIRGVKIDLEYLNQMESVLKLELDTLYECMRSSVADEIQLIELGAWNSEIQKRKTPAAKLKVPYPVFNFASNKQLQELLYGKLGLPIQRNKKRKPTVDDAALEKLEKKHFVVEMLRKYRELSKVLGTYVTGMKDRVENGRIYPSFKINGTVTGRISSENPNCLSMDTEIMTDGGWKTYENIGSHKVAQYTGSSIEFVNPLSIYKSSNSVEKMVSISNEHFDMLLTPNHRVIYVDRKTKKISERIASKFPKDAHILHGALYTPENPLRIPAALVKLIVAYQADAEYREDSSTIRFRFKKERKFKRIKQILDELGVAYDDTPSNNGIYQVCIKNGINLIKNYFENGKTFSYALLHLSQDLRNIFLNELFYWDGCFTRMDSYCTTNYTNASLVQAMASLNGTRALIAEYTAHKQGRDWIKTAYNVYFTHRDYSGTANAIITDVAYLDNVWCVSVPSGMILCRRNNKTFITGNCQNLPRNGAVRGIFVPDDGYKMFSSDFGALEVVIEAHFTQDKNLLRIINDGLSKHDITAEALGIDRQTAKTINFAAQYQCSPRKFAEILKISQKEAEDVFNRYWDTYSGVRAVYNDCCKAVDSGQPIINLFGRKRHFPTDFDVAWMRDAAHRQAYSALIQGSGADIAHMAYYMVHAELKCTGYGDTIFGVHDQVIIQAKVEYLDEASKILHDVMNSVGELSGLSVPLTADLQGPWDRFAK